MNVNIIFFFFWFREWEIVDFKVLVDYIFKIYLEVAFYPSFTDPAILNLMIHLYKSFMRLLTELSIFWTYTFPGILLYVGALHPSINGGETASIMESHE